MRHEKPNVEWAVKDKNNLNGMRKVWYAIWEYLRDNGAQPRWKIVRDCIDCRCDSPHIHHVYFRGQNSTMFSAMHYANIIRYDKRTNCWYAVAEVDWRKKRTYFRKGKKSV